MALILLTSKNGHHVVDDNIFPFPIIAYRAENHDFLKETLLMSFSNVCFGDVSTTFRAPFRPIILERRQKSLRPI